MFYAVGARVMGVSMVMEAGGRGLMCACVPPPPHRIARRLPKTRINNAGWGPRVHPNLPRASLPPPRLIRKKGQLPDLLVFPYTGVRQYSLIGYRIGLIIKYGIILVFSS